MYNVVVVVVVQSFGFEDDYIYPVPEDDWDGCLECTWLHSPILERQTLSQCAHLWTGSAGWVMIPVFFSSLMRSMVSFLSLSYRATPVLTAQRQWLRSEAASSICSGSIPQAFRLAFRVSPETLPWGSTSALALPELTIEDLLRQSGWRHPDDVAHPSQLWPNNPALNACGLCHI